MSEKRQPSPEDPDAPAESINRAHRLATHLREQGGSMVDEGVRPTLMVLSFEGWNDAGGAASAAVRTMAQAMDAEPVERVIDEEYYDFQFSRPRVTNSSGHREIIWPSVQILRASPAHGEFDLLFVHGVEPSFRWQSFTAELLTKAAEHQVSAIVLVGALLADVPHSRPIPASFSSDDEELQQLLEIDAPSYEGPTGIVGVLAHTAYQAGVPAISLWAAVPHYVGQAPSPKAQLAVMRRLEEMIGMPLQTGELVEDADAWERGVNELAEEDTEVAEYVKRLEEAADATNMPEASGEAIAEEFERYLRHRRPPEPPTS